MFQRKILTKPSRRVESVSTRVKFLAPTLSFQPWANASPSPSRGAHWAFLATYVLPVAVSLRVSVALS